MPPNSPFKGTVSLVGAGPGDPGLMTVRGLERIRRADVIVYDHLVNRELLKEAPPTARLIYVGKTAGKHTLSQDEINEILAYEAQAGQAVVRLKGGDPFIFGRGAEECEYLRSRGIAFEVVPGVSALSAVPAYAGIPLTHRDCSAVFVAIAGQEHSGKTAPQVDWQALAGINGTLVIFMGVLSIRQIAEELIRHGKPPETPAAIIRWGTYPHQKTIEGTLETIAGQIEQMNLRPPGLIIIGDVVRFRQRLAWFESISGNFDLNH